MMKREQAGFEADLQSDMFQSRVSLNHPVNQLDVSDRIVVVEPDTVC